MIEIDCKKCFYCNGSECTYYHTDNPNVAVKKCANDSFRNYLNENDMVIEFNGFTKGVIGKKLYADSVLKNMQKSELIELLHLAQHNYNTLMWFYTNAVNLNMDKYKEHDKEIRDEVIDKLSCKLMTYFADCQLIEENVIVRDALDEVIKSIDEIAEQMKEVGE